MSPLTDPIGPDLTATLRALKLGKLTATLPERLTLARQTDMPHADFLQLILSDEVARREAGSIALRAKNAGLDPAAGVGQDGAGPDVVEGPEVVVGRLADHPFLGGRPGARCHGGLGAGEQVVG